MKKLAKQIAIFLWRRESVMSQVQIMKREQTFFNDIEVGSEITPLTKGPYTLMTMAKFAAMNGDFYPSHYDNKWAIEVDRLPGAIAHGLQITSYLSQLLTDWMGPNGTLKKFASQVRAQTFVGDILTMRGRVTKKYIKDGENYLECEVWGEKQDGTMVVQGSGTVTLPARLQPQLGRIS
jgi:acyl dehydratase